MRSPRRRGHEEAAQLLSQTLEEEKAADQKLNQIALSEVNRTALERLPEPAEAPASERPVAACAGPLASPHALRPALLPVAARQARRHAWPLLQVQDLTTRFATPDGEVAAVSGVSFAIETGRSVGVVGEIGLGQDPGLPLDHGPFGQERPLQRQRALSRPGAARPGARRAQRDPRRRARDDLPGPDDLAQPSPQDLRAR